MKHLKNISFLFLILIVLFQNGFGGTQWNENDPNNDPDWDWTDKDNYVVFMDISQPESDRSWEINRINIKKMKAQ